MPPRPAADTNVGCQSRPRHRRPSWPRPPAHTRRARTWQEQTRCPEQQPGGQTQKATQQHARQTRNPNPPTHSHAPPTRPKQPPTSRPARSRNTPRAPGAGAAVAAAKNKGQTHNRPHRRAAPNGQDPSQRARAPQPPATPGSHARGPRRGATLGGNARDNVSSGRPPRRAATPSSHAGGATLGGNAGRKRWATTF